MWWFCNVQIGVNWGRPRSLRIFENSTTTRHGFSEDIHRRNPWLTACSCQPHLCGDVTRVLQSSLGLAHLPMEIERFFFGEKSIVSHNSLLDDCVFSTFFLFPSHPAFIISRKRPPQVVVDATTQWTLNISWKSWGRSLYRAMLQIRSSTNAVKRGNNIEINYSLWPTRTFNAIFHTTLIFTDFPDCKRDHRSN